LGEIFLSRTALAEAAKDTVPEQKTQAGKLHPQKESPTVPTRAQDQSIHKRTDFFHI